MFKSKDRWVSIVIAVTQALAPGIDGIDKGTRFSAGRIVAAAVVGGTASSITGGKFANGAVTGAFSRALNDELHFNGKKLKWFNDEGEVVKEWSAVSGAPGTTSEDQYKRNYGPIPEGEYTLDPALTDEFKWYDPRDYDWYGASARDAWGDFRTPLSINHGTSIGPRTGGFFVHGGSVPGSSGCIDLTSHNNEFHHMLRNYNKSIKLKVNY